LTVAAGPTAKSSAGRLAALNALAGAHRLIVMDDLWTAELRGLLARGEAPPEDTETLQELGNDLRAGLTEVQPLARDLGWMLNDLTEAEVEEGLDALASQVVQPGDVSSEWRAWLPDYTFRGAAIAACDYIVSEAEAEAAAVGKQLAELRDGAVPSGDLGRAFKCALILVTAAAAVVGAVGGAAAGVAAGAVGAAAILAWTGAGAWCLSAVTAGILTWSEAKCSSTLAFIGRGRR
jgi:hypothetical protein